MAFILLTSVHCYATQIDGDKRSQSESSIHYRMLVDLY